MLDAEMITVAAQVGEYGRLHLPLGGSSTSDLDRRKEKLADWRVLFRSLKTHAEQGRPCASERSVSRAFLLWHKFLRNTVLRSAARI